MSTCGSALPCVAGVGCAWPRGLWVALARAGHGLARLCTVGLGCAWHGVSAQGCTPSGWAVRGFLWHGLLAQGCVWSGSHARGCTWPGWAVHSCGGSAPVARGCAWSGCAQLTGAVHGPGPCRPPQQMWAGTPPVQNKRPGRGHLSGRRGTRPLGSVPGGWLCPAGAGWGPRQDRTAPGDCSFPAALPCRFLPSCSQPKFSSG